MILGIERPIFEACLLKRKILCARILCRAGGQLGVLLADIATMFKCCALSDADTIRISALLEPRLQILTQLATDPRGGTVGRTLLIQWQHFTLVFQQDWPVLDELARQMHAAELKVANLMYPSTLAVKPVESLESTLRASERETQSLSTRTLSHARVRS